MLFYFTATGNSLYAARAIEPNPISIPQAIRREPLSYRADAIGIVAPVYGHELPNMVKDFIRRASFDTDYFYLVLTYGRCHGNAVELADGFCRDCGVEPAYINTLLMVDNWLPAFDMDEERALDKGIDRNLSRIVSDVASRRRWKAPVSEGDREVHRMFLSMMARQPRDAWQHLVAVGDGCTGCGVCEHVCPSGSVRVVDGRAVFTSGMCQTCLACVHNCPHGAMMLTVPERNPGARFRNEHVTLKDIMDSNDRTAEVE